MSLSAYTEPLPSGATWYDRHPVLTAVGGALLISGVGPTLLAVAASQLPVPGIVWVALPLLAALAACVWLWREAS